MTITRLLLGYAALVLPTAVMAMDSNPPSTSATTSKPDADPNRVICRSEDEIGSLIAKKKVCLTAAEWKERRFRQGQWVEHQSTYNSQPNGR